MDYMIGLVVPRQMESPNLMASLRRCGQGGASVAQWLYNANGLVGKKATHPSPSLRPAFHAVPITVSNFSQSVAT